MTPDGGTGVYPVGAGYRPDAFFDCLRFTNAEDGSFVGLDYLVPPTVFGEIHRLELDAANDCPRAIRVTDWGATDPRFTVTFDPRSLAPGERATGHVAITFRAAEPSGPIDQRVAVAIADDAGTADARVITFLGSVHASCATLDQTSCSERPSCSWDVATSSCTAR